MLDSTIKKFTELFGEALEEDYDPETFVAVSANRWLGLVQLNKLHDLYSTFRRYTIQNMPKPDKKKIEIVKYQNRFFKLDIIRTILKEFYNNSVFEVTIGKRNRFFLLIFKLGEYGIVFPHLEEEDKEMINYWEVEYKWNDIFLEFTVQDDMIL